MNSLNLRGFTFLMLFSVFSGESQGTIINGDFATGDLTGWTTSAIDQAGQPTTSLVSVESSGGTFFADFPTGQFADDVFISTLEQTFTVTAQEPILSFEFSLPSIIEDNTGSGNSPFFDAFVVSLENVGTGDFFDLLLVDQFSVLADPFGTAPGTVTLGAPSSPLFDFVFNADLKLSE